MTLNQRQMAWQYWRNDYYSRAMDEARGIDRELERGMNYRAVGGLLRQRNLLEGTIARYHEVIVPADSRLKASRRSGDEEQILAALVECERIMTDEEW